ncbi:MAG: CocE/NonD family hydrolase [Bryobacteraceae bacterium]
MKPTTRIHWLIRLTLFCCACISIAQDASNGASVFTKTEAMIPMRDGVKLHTVIFAPREQQERLPILLDRTPYGAMSDEMDLCARFAHLISDARYSLSRALQIRSDVDAGRCGNEINRRDV